jgi:hypothetical protein
MTQANRKNQCSGATPPCSIRNFANLANLKVEEGGKTPGRCKKFEKRRRMSSAGGETEAMKKVGAPTQFLTVIQKHDMENISRTNGAMIRKNE